MIRAGFGALLSHWARHPLQLAMLLLGLSLATALWSGVQAINAEARASYDRAAAVLGQDSLPRLVADGGIAEADYVALRRAGWRVSPVVEGRVQLGGADLRLLGVDPLTLPAGAQAVDLAAGDGLLPFLTPPGVLYAHPDTLATLAADAGLPVLRAAETLPPGTGLMDIGLAQALLGRAGQISYLLVAEGAAPGRPLAGVAPGLRLETPQGAADLARLTDSFHLNLTAFGFLAFAVGLFIVHSAIGLAFEQRRGVFRTLRALGLSAAALTGLLLAELLLLALMAGLAGVVMGYGVAAVLLPDVAATLSGLYGADVPGSLALRPGWWAAGLGIAVAGTLVAAGQSLWRVWHLPLLASAQPRAWARASGRGLWRQAVAGLVLLAGAAGLLARADGLIAGFAGLAGLLLGAALGLPVLLAGLTALAQRLARGVLAQWFWADTRQQLPGLSLSLMALLLALAANIGVGTMVASFRQTFTGWLDQRLVAELYLTAPDAETAVQMQAWLAPRADAVLPILQADGLLQGAPAQYLGMVDHATYRDHWPLLSARDGVWDALAAGQGVLVNEQLARRQGLGPGDPVELPDGAVLPVAGVYSDYGNPLPQVILTEPRFAALFPAAPRLRFALRAAFALPEDAVTDQAAIKALSLAIFERTFTVTAALNVLTLGVAGLAMFASLTTLSGMRLPQLAPVWAMGLTRRRLAGLDLLRTLLLAGLVLLAALPLGLALAWVLLAVVNVAAFGWRLPMFLFPGDWLRLAGFALLAAGLAAALPVARLLRLRPADLLRVFAHER